MPSRASEIIVALQTDRASHAAQIACGDLNVTPDSDVVAALRAAGFTEAHKDVHSCNSNGVAKLIDYVFSRGDIAATPIAPRPIHDTTLISIFLAGIVVSAIMMLIAQN